MYFIWLVGFILTTAKVVLAHADIQVKCGKDSVVVIWKVTETPFKLLLGDCFPSKFSPTADGGGQAVFHYHFSDCLFRQKETPEELIYENELTFWPLIKSDSAPRVYPIKCVSERPFPAVKPVFGVLQGQGELTFHMGLLNDDLSGPALSNSFPLGSIINIGASVAQQAHQSLMLYLEECVASNTLALEPQSWTYPIITNKGCLVDGKTGSSRFLPRNQSSSLVLQLQTFRFAAQQEVYIHCKLAVWDPEDYNEENKACNYNKSTGKTPRTSSEFSFGTAVTHFVNERKHFSTGLDSRKQVPCGYIKTTELQSSLFSHTFPLPAAFIPSISLFYYLRDNKIRNTAWHVMEKPESAKVLS